MKTLKDISTRELLSAYHSRYNKDNADWWERTREGYVAPEHIFSRMGPGGVPDNVAASYDAIIAELSTREHIPSKREAKLIRQLKAKTGLSEREIRVQFGEKFFPAKRYPVSVEQYNKYKTLYGTDSMARFVIRKEAK